MRNTAQPVTMRKTPHQAPHAFRAEEERRGRQECNRHATDLAVHRESSVIERGARSFIERAA
jgi:hypothetical protein